MESGKVGKWVKSSREYRVNTRRISTRSEELEAVVAAATIDEFSHFGQISSTACAASSRGTRPPCALHLHLPGDISTYLIPHTLPSTSLHLHLSTKQRHPATQSPRHRTPHPYPYSTTRAPRSSLPRSLALSTVWRQLPLLHPAHTPRSVHVLEADPKHSLASLPKARLPRSSCHFVPEYSLPRHLRTALHWLARSPLLHLPLSSTITPVLCY